MVSALAPLLLAVLLAWSSTDAFSPPSSHLISNARHVGIPTTARYSTAAELPTTASSTTTPTPPVGISKTTTVAGSGRAIRAGDVVIVKYFCTASGSDVSFARSDRQRIVACDGTMIRGWDAAIRTMREGERATIVISDPALTYGAAGVPPFVPPNAQIQIDLEVIMVEENVDGGGLSGSDASGLDAMLDGPVSRPRTPGAIAAAYEQRMREKAMNAPAEKEGVEYWIDKIKGSYFFGLFEGETGQKAPWYLTPSITFPIAFLIVGAAFWASLAGGAISERGMPTTDELDEIIVSSGDIIRSSVAMAMIMLQG
ncbi:hypothetical protein ACHAXH_006646 [Discostella pseudostelligera]